MTASTDDEQAGIRAALDGLGLTAPARAAWGLQEAQERVLLTLFRSAQGPEGIRALLPRSWRSHGRAELLAMGVEGLCLDALSGDVR